MNFTKTHLSIDEFIRFSGELRMTMDGMSDMEVISEWILPLLLVLRCLLSEMELLRSLDGEMVGEIM